MDRKTPRSPYTVHPHVLAHSSCIPVDTNLQSMPVTAVHSPSHLQSVPVTAVHSPSHLQSVPVSAVHSPSHLQSVPVTAVHSRSVAHPQLELLRGLKTVALDYKSSEVDWLRFQHLKHKFRQTDQSLIETESIYSSLAQQPNAGQCRLIVEVSRSHTMTQHSR